MGVELSYLKLKAMVAMFVNLFSPFELRKEVFKVRGRGVLRFT